MDLLSEYAYENYFSFLILYDFVLNNVYASTFLLIVIIKSSLKQLYEDAEYILF